MPSAKSKGAHEIVFGKRDSQKDQFMFFSRQISTCSWLTAAAMFMQHDIFSIEKLLSGTVCM